MSNRDYIDDLTLMLMYLTAWEEGSGENACLRTWKGYDFDSLNRLADAGYIEGSQKAKSDYLTEEGARRAIELCEHYGMSESDIHGRPSFRIKLDFNFTELTCMREILVPQDLSFDDLHTIIQACIGWLNYHLYDFRTVVNGKEAKIAIPDDEFYPDPSIEEFDSRTILLSDVFPRTRNALYSYDYGDGWEIRMKICKGDGYVLNGNSPFCIAASGDAPPDDVGGEGGFMRFLQIIKNADDPDHDEMVAWGEGQGFEHVDRDSINRRLEQWEEFRAL